MVKAETARALMRHKGYPDSWPVGEVLVDAPNRYALIDPRCYQCQIQGVNEFGELCDPADPYNTPLVVIYSSDMVELGATDGRLYWDVDYRGKLTNSYGDPVGGLVAKILALFAESLETAL